MTDRELMQQALEALEDACGRRCNAENNPCWQREIADALRERLAQPEQEPFGYFQLDLRLDAWVQNRNSNKGVAFYTTPLRREWQGLAADSTIQTVPAQGGLLPAQPGIRGGLAHDAQNKEKNG